MVRNNQGDGQILLIRYKFIGAILTVALALAGCTTFTNIEAGLNNLLGKQIESAFQVLGYPANKQQYGTRTVYYWGVNQTGTAFVPQTATTYGYAGPYFYQGTTSYSQPVAVNMHCEIRVITDQRDRIVDWWYNGNVAGCERYGAQLKTIGGS